MPKYAFVWAFYIETYGILQFRHRPSSSFSPLPKQEQLQQMGFARSEGDDKLNIELSSQS